MCWSLPVSIAAAIWGFSVCIYLRHRNYSVRDKWYALFLGSFTCTQVIDAVLWILKGDEEDIPCTDLNYYFSRFIIGPVIFSQPWTLTMFPSHTNDVLKIPYRVGVLAGCAVPIIYLGCSTLYFVEPPALVDLPTMLYGGVYPNFWVMFVGVGFWALGAALFVRPFLASVQVLAVGTVVLTLLRILDGTFRLVSKMCTYCLILSFVWILEPLWMPPDSSPPQDQEQDSSYQETLLFYDPQDKQRRNNNINGPIAYQQL